MKKPTKFTFIHQDHYQGREFNYVEVGTNDVTLTEVLQEFRSFLQAAGYSIRDNEYVEVVSYAEPESLD